MAKKKPSNIVATTFKACLKGDVYPQTFEAGSELSGEALEIGEALEMMGGEPREKTAGAAPENKAGAAGDNDGGAA